MRKVRRPIERINIPNVVVALIDAATLFRHNRMRRELRSNARDDELLGGAISHGHGVKQALVFDSHLLVVAHQNCTGVACNVRGEGNKIRAVHRVHFRLAVGAYGPTVPEHPCTLVAGITSHYGLADNQLCGVGLHAPPLWTKRMRR